MQVQRSVGLQWSVTFVHMIGTVATLLVAAGCFLLLRRFGFSDPVALVASLILGLLVAVFGAVITFLLARSVKLRLWDAGDFAARIARGDFSHRITPGPADEVGWLETRLNEMADHLETAVNDLRRLAEQNERLAEQAGRGAALEERTRLARDLHDTVNQQLFALAVGIATVRRSLEGAKISEEEAARDLASLEEMAREAHAQIREIILHLRPVSLERHGLAMALREYAGRVAAEAGWELEVDVPDTVEVSGKLQETLFRVGQEALSNVRKHAKASRVTVSLKQEGTELVFTIADDGIGFDPKTPPRLTAVGLVGMRERVQGCGGTLHVDSSPGRGTRITAVVPVAKEGGTM